jgi:hypothetical protein
VAKSGAKTKDQVRHVERTNRDRLQTVTKEHGWRDELMLVVI